MIPQFRSLIFAGLLILTQSLTADTVAIRSLKPVLCWPTEEILSSLTNKFQERIIWVAQVHESEYPRTIALLQNPLSQTWTILEFDSVKACVLGNGIGSMHNVLTNDGKNI